ncbi:MAG: CRTAC1 family protein [Acidobacteriota bacterium]
MSDEQRPVEEVPGDDRVIGQALKWSALVALALALVAAIVWFARREKDVEPVVVDRGEIEAPARLVPDAATRPELRFTDVTTASGIDFVHFNGARGGKLLPETMGSGAAFFDLEGDGDADLLLVNGAPWPGDPAPATSPTLALYRNDGSGRFEDVTRGSGLDVILAGCGVACGDVDGDGDVDLFLSNLGPNRFFRNDGNGRFTDATAASGLVGGEDDWSTGAGFFDAEGDGDLDLFVTNYVKWSKSIDERLNFTLNGTDRAYGPPKLYEGTYCLLYRNDGTGRFTDVSEEAGIRVDNPATGEAAGKGLALTFVDVGRDGLMDVFVANDTVGNFLFKNLGEGRFQEIGSRSGVAYDGSGMATGAMGIDVADHSNGGYLGLAIGNFANESSSLYVEQRNPWRFADMASSEGIGSPSRLRLSFGIFFFDVDLDGRLDLMQANGHLEEEINEVQPSQHYRQQAQLFWNRGSEASSTFVMVPEEELGDLARTIVGRGATCADIDGDGDLDVLLTQVAGPPLLLRNDQETGHHWLRVRLDDRKGTRGNADAIGAWVELSSGGVSQRRQVMPTRSYLSQVELPVTFGLGAATTVDSLVVTWPDGTKQEVSVDAVDHELVVQPQG